MSRRVFLDVGGHLGETLEEVVKPRWAFDRIWTFEPASSCLPSLRQHVDERVAIVQAGWWSSDTEMDLHDPGSMGASVASGKARTEDVDTCHFVDAARWMEDNVASDDTVWLKLNCEASEAEVLERLLETNQIARVDHLLVHFDVLKVPGMEHRAEECRAKLGAAGIPFSEPEDIMFGRGRGPKTANWLAWTEASRLGRLRYSILNRVIFRTRQRLYPLKKALVAKKQTASGA